MRNFGSKAALLQAALEWEINRFLTRLSDTGEPRVDLLNLVKAAQSLFARRGQLVLDLVLEFPLKAELEDLSQIVVEAIVLTTSIVEKYQAKGILRGGDPFEALLTLIGPLLLPTIKHEPWQQLPSGPEARVEAFLKCWEQRPA